MEARKVSASHNWKVLAQLRIVVTAVGDGLVIMDSGPLSGPDAAATSLISFTKMSAQMLRVDNNLGERQREKTEDGMEGVGGSVHFMTSLLPPIWVEYNESHF